MAEPAKRRATYADLDALPDGTKAQLVDGSIFVPPRPSVPHQEAESALGEGLRPPFHRGRGGPGGWIILVEFAQEWIRPSAPRAGADARRATEPRTFCAAR